MSGVGNGCEAAPSVSGLALQSMAGELWPTPRGSKPTMSKRWLSASNRPGAGGRLQEVDGRAARAAQVEEQRPDPLAWSFAGTRATAMSDRPAARDGRSRAAPAGSRTARRAPLRTPPRRARRTGPGARRRGPPRRGPRPGWRRRPRGSTSARDGTRASIAPSPARDAGVAIQRPGARLWPRHPTSAGRPAGNPRSGPCRPVAVLRGAGTAWQRGLPSDGLPTVQATVVLERQGALRWPSASSNPRTRSA